MNIEGPFLFNLLPVNDFDMTLIAAKTSEGKKMVG